MNFKAIVAVAALGFSLAAQAGLYQSGVLTLNQAIPDANLTGWSTTYNFSGADTSITDVSVKLNLSGGYNGDLYAYLSFDGTLVPLLNRVGVGTGSGAQYTFGYSSSGMSVTLVDGAPDIHVSGPTLSGSFSPDGRTLSPLSSAAAFAAYDTAQRVGFAAFDGENPNGAWTLFLADASGGAQSMLVSWELEITAVPEPVNIALGLFAGLGLAGAVARKVRKQAVKS